VVRIAHGQRGVALTMGLTAFAAAMAALEVAATGGEREAIAAALAATERESVRALAALASARGG
jgi:hypothetical protein